VLGVIAKRAAHGDVAKLLLDSVYFELAYEIHPLMACVHVHDRQAFGLYGRHRHSPCQLVRQAIALLTALQSLNDSAAGFG
jgi:hypothetical protein